MLLLASVWRVPQLIIVFTKSSELKSEPRDYGASRKYWDLIDTPGMDIYSILIFTVWPGDGYLQYSHLLDFPI